jgi:hypothetical protein
VVYEHILSVPEDKKFRRHFETDTDISSRSVLGNSENKSSFSSSGTENPREYL